MSFSKTNISEYKLGDPPFKKEKREWKMCNKIPKTKYVKCLEEKQSKKFWH